MKKSDKITKVKKGWAVDTRSIGGGREIVGSRDEALDVRDQAFADHQNGEYIPRTKNPRVCDVAEAFINYVRAKPDATEDKTQTHRRNLQFIFNNVSGLRQRKVMDVTVAYIETEIIPAIFVQTHSTGLNRFNTLRQLLKYAVKNNWARTNPCRDVDLPKRKIEHNPPPRISREDIRRIIEHAGEYALRIKFAGYTGVRAGEQVACGWDNLDLDGAVYTVTHARDRSGGLGTVKTKAGVRSIPLPAALVQDLKEWKLAQPLEQRSRGLVFPSLAGNIADPSNWRKRGLHPACVAAGIEPIRWHDLRHFYASVLLFETDYTDAQITQFLGHTSIDFTRKQYAHWLSDPRRDKTLADKMTAAFDI